MGIDSFPPWSDKVRNDPLGAAGYNTLIARQKWAEALFLAEHISTDVGGGAGEHNAAEVPREVGSVYVAGGPTYLKEGFRHATGVTRPALGTFAVALDTNVYTNSAQMTVQVQNTSERTLGAGGKPCISTFTITSTGEIQVCQKYLTTALGVAGNAWAAEDDSFVMAIHGAPLTVGLPGTTGILKQRGDELSDVSTDYNATVQFDADVRAKFLLDHTAAGLHSNREVAQCWANVKVRSGGAAFDIVETGTRNALTVSRPSIGIARLTNTTAWVLSAQPFVMVDYQRSNGGAASDVYCAVCPRSSITTNVVDVHLFQYTAGTNVWARADTDFYIAIHAGY